MLIRSIDDIQQLLSPLKRLKTTTTPMEASNDNNEATAKAEPVKTISKSGYLVKVMDKKRIRYSFYRTTLFILGLRYN